MNRDKYKTRAEIIGDILGKVRLLHKIGFEKEEVVIDCMEKAFEAGRKAEAARAEITQRHTYKAFINEVEAREAETARAEYWKNQATYMYDFDHSISKEDTLEWLEEREKEFNASKNKKK